MTSSTLADLLRDSETRGWAVAEPKGPHFMVKHQLTSEAELLGWRPIENRRGEDPVAILKPQTQKEAHPASISAEVGLGQQPLHTDGAHLRKVPDYVLLWSMNVSTTPTRVWDATKSIEPADRDGIFSVTSGGETWLTPAWDGGLRFDPVCMNPLDAFARRLAVMLENPPDGAVDEIAWNTAGKVLLIRNRRVLHGRAAITDGDTGRRIGRVAYHVGGAR